MKNKNEEVARKVVVRALKGVVVSAEVFATLVVVAEEILMVTMAEAHSQMKAGLEEGARLLAARHKFVPIEKWNELRAAADDFGLNKTYPTDSKKLVRLKAALRDVESFSV